MKDQVWQEKQFLLSCFTRQNIKISHSAHEFINNIISENWDYPLDLNELDYFISNEYQKYLINI